MVAAGDRARWSEKRKLKINGSCASLVDYADDLIEGHEDLDRWPDKVRLMAGKLDRPLEGFAAEIPVRWRRAGGVRRGDRGLHHPPRSTLFGCASFVLAVAADHPLADKVAATDPKAAEFVAECRRGAVSEAAVEAAEKAGYDTGLSVAHPFDPTRTVPVWIANFVLMDYGTGAIFGCPAQ